MCVTADQECLFFGASILRLTRKFDIVAFDLILFAIDNDRGVLLTITSVLVGFRIPMHHISVSFVPDLHLIESTNLADPQICEANTKHIATILRTRRIFRPMKMHAEGLERLVGGNG